MSQKESKKKPTTSKKKLRRQARKMEPRDLMDKMLKEKPHLAGRVSANPQGSEKMSAVILEYAEPLMEAAENVEQQNRAIAMAIICWNASLLNETDRERSLAAIYADTDEVEASNLKEMITFMVSRKQDLFPHNKKKIADWMVKDRGDQLFLEVATILPKEDEDR
ncbi:MAG: hypothetical protein QG552_166 [Thermodesulfobacteriota bacterium]|nr:hypothetical protein [Thermodesulfobacteriota bacterium]